MPNKFCKMRLRLLVSILSPILMFFYPQFAYGLDLDLIFVVEGDSISEDLGHHVQSAGDLDGDGYSEVIVGSLHPSSTKVYNGGNPAVNFPLAVFDGFPLQNSWIMDITGNGIPELAIFRSIPNEISQCDIYYGSSTIYQKTEPDITLHADLMEGFDGIAVEDYDADGENEIITSANFPEYWPYESIFYIYEIQPDFDSIADDTLILRNQSIISSYTDECVGDINGDGYADFVISTYAGANPAYILIFFGGENIDSIPDLQIFTPFDDGPGHGYFGYSIVPAKDLNKDGYDDFIITSTSGPPCIFYGGNPFNPTPKILEYDGKNANICGDINHDGWEDIAVGYPDLDFGYGKIYVYYGAYDMDTITDITIRYDELPYICYEFGKSLGPAGDFNGDGVDDLAVGADRTIESSKNSGRLFIFAGSDSLPTPAEDEPNIPVPRDYDILEQNYPNPFNNSTIIEYSLYGMSDREVELSIYNILGQKVRTLYSGLQSGGEHVMFWDGLDDVGHGVPSGIYFYRLQSSGKVISKKMVYLK